MREGGEERWLGVSTVWLQAHHHHPAQHLIAYSYSAVSRRDKAFEFEDDQWDAAGRHIG